MAIPIQIKLSRDLRKNLTPEEKIVWKILRNRQFHGLKFTRQYPILISKRDKKNQFYIADFYCASHKLILELDGGIHDEQIDYDKNRDSTLNEMGFNVVRLKNEMINEDPNKALRKIADLFKLR